MILPWNDTGRSDEIGRTPCWRWARQRGKPSPHHRRSRCRDWSCRDKPCRNRRSPAAPRARRRSQLCPSCCRGRKRPDSGQCRAGVPPASLFQTRSDCLRNSAPCPRPIVRAGRLCHDVSASVWSRGQWPDDSQRFGCSGAARPPRAAPVQFRGP